MTTLVLDACAAVRIVVGPDPTSIRAAVAAADVVITPPLFNVEVANALWKYVQAGLLTGSQASSRLQRAVQLSDSQPPAAEQASSLAEALTESCRLGHPVYDMVYLVTARRNSATLATCDQRLAALATSQGIPTITNP